MLQTIKNRLFRNSVDDEKTGGGLFVTVEELMEQRQYTRYIKTSHKSLSKTTRAGDVKSAFKGRGVELAEIRAYSFGDDIRDIDWRVTARKEDPYTKLYVEERDREIYVLLDLSPSMVFGTRKELKSVAAAKIASLLGWLSMENKDRFGVIIFDGVNSFVFKPQSHRANMLAIFSKISEISSNVLKPSEISSNNMEKSLQLLKKSIKSQAIVFVVSDFSGFEMFKKPLSALAKGAKIYCINVLDVLEEKAPRAGEYMIKSANDSLVFDSRTDKFQAEYQKYFTAKRGLVKDFCNKFAIKYLEVRTDIDLHRQIKI